MLFGGVKPATSCISTNVQGLLLHAAAARRADVSWWLQIPLIGWIGRLDHQKGPDIVLDAVPGFASRSCQVFPPRLLEKLHPHTPPCSSSQTSHHQPMLVLILGGHAAKQPRSAIDLAARAFRLHGLA